jgi:hypothetical protein
LGITQRATTVAGLTLIIISILTIVVVGLTAAGGSDKNAFDRPDVPEFLKDTEDNAGLLQAAGAVGIVNDSVFVPLAGVALYIIFRDRNRMLATLVLGGILVSAAASIVTDALNIILVELAEDYVNGGPPGVAAGDPAALETARLVGMITTAFFNVILTPLGLSFVALGLLITQSPPGLVNPPKWMGWVVLVAGVAGWLAWTVVAADPLFVFFPINLILTLVFGFALGVWLLRSDANVPLSSGAATT